MDGLIENVEEFNNAGALLGLDGLDGDLTEELLGALKQMNPIKRQKVINKLANPGGSSKGSRAEMEKFFSELPAHIKAGLTKKELRLADTVIYSVKPVSSKTIKMFETQDDKEIGIRSVSNAKLPKNQAMLVSGIILLVGVAADATKDAVMATSFAAVETYPAIANGEFSLKANKKQLVPETSNIVFKTNNLHLVRSGYYKLDNPRLIVDDVLIELVVELGTQTGIAANTQVFMGLHGTVTIP